LFYSSDYFFLLLLFPLLSSSNDGRDNKVYRFRPCGIKWGEILKDTFRLKHKKSDRSNLGKQDEISELKGLAWSLRGLVAYPGLKFPN
jgi:hypothetical protein